MPFGIVITARPFLYIDDETDLVAYRLADGAGYREWHGSSYMVLVFCLLFSSFCFNAFISFFLYFVSCLFNVLLWLHVFSLIFVQCYFYPLVLRMLMLIDLLFRARDTKKKGAKKKFGHLSVFHCVCIVHLLFAVDGGVFFFFFFGLL